MEMVDYLTMLDLAVEFDLCIMTYEVENTQDFIAKASDAGYLLMWDDKRLGWFVSKSQ